MIGHWRIPLGSVKLVRAGGRSQLWREAAVWSRNPPLLYLYALCCPESCTMSQTGQQLYRSVYHCQKALLIFSCESFSGCIMKAPSLMPEATRNSSMCCCA